MLSASKIAYDSLVERHFQEKNILFRQPVHSVEYFLLHISTTHSDALFISHGVLHINYSASHSLICLTQKRTE